MKAAATTTATRRNSLGNDSSTTSSDDDDIAKVGEDTIPRTRRREDENNDTFDDTLWDDISFNPYINFYEQGKKQGQIAANERNLKTGIALGRLKGIEYGIEIGYIRGILKAMMTEIKTNIINKETPSSIKTTISRIEKNIVELSNLLDGFPTPAELFRSDQSTLDSNHNATFKTDHDEAEQNGDNDNLNDCDREKDDKQSKKSNYETDMNANTVDINKQMEKIKSRFQLLIVQYKRQSIIANNNNNFVLLPLRRVMDEVATSETTTTTATLSKNNDFEDW